MKITTPSSIADFALLCRQLGVTRTLFQHGPAGECKAVLLTADYLIVGTARLDSALPEVDALDDAFARLKHRLGIDVTLDGVATGASMEWAL